MSKPDTTSFFRAVIDHLLHTPDGSTFIARLGLDPAVKEAWAALGLSKSKKMANILDTRPDLVARFLTPKAQPMVRLEPLGQECAPQKPIPPFNGKLPTRSKSKTVVQEPVASAGTVESDAGQSVARKQFMKEVLDALATTDGCEMDLPQLGSVPGIQRAWKIGGLGKRLKMTEVLRERPDLVSVNVNSSGHLIVSLTELGVQCCVEASDVPEPDPNVCPAPTASRQQKGPHLDRGCLRQSNSNRERERPSRNRYQPYSVATDRGRVNGSSSQDDIGAAWMDQQQPPPSHAPEYAPASSLTGYLPTVMRHPPTTQYGGHPQYGMPVHYGHGLPHPAYHANHHGHPLVPPASGQWPYRYG